MARAIGKLTALAVDKAKRRGYYGDGGGLFLQVSATGAKSWVFRFKEAGKLREMGLGPTHTVGLAFDIVSRRGGPYGSGQNRSHHRRPAPRRQPPGEVNFAHQPLRATPVLPFYGWGRVSRDRNLSSRHLPGVHHSR